MKYKIDFLNKDEYPLLDELARDTNLQESIDFDCEFIVARNGTNKIIGCAGVNLKMPRYPQFEHIIIAPEYQNTRLGILLMSKIEKFLRNKSYKEYVSYILNTNNPMQVLAKKWGMESYEKDSEGVWFYKILNKES